MTDHGQARPRRRIALRSERGAAAVEFALVVPILVLLLVGIIEFSTIYNEKASLSAAAREGARVMTLTNKPADAVAAVRAAAGVPLTAAQVGVTPSTCVGASPTTTVTVTVTYRHDFAYGFLGGSGRTLTSKAVMRCGG